MNVKNQFKGRTAVQWQDRKVPIVGIKEENSTWWLEVELHNGVYPIHQRLIEQWFEDDSKTFEPLN